MAAPDVTVVWLRARPEVLAERFASADDHRPAYGDSTVAFLAEQAARREPLLDRRRRASSSMSTTLTVDEVVERTIEALG